jgi:hypothetical protein
MLKKARIRPSYHETQGPISRRDEIMVKPIYLRTSVEWSLLQRLISGFGLSLSLSFCQASLAYHDYLVIGRRRIKRRQSCLKIIQ